MSWIGEKRQERGSVGSPPAGARQAAPAAPAAPAASPASSASLESPTVVRARGLNPANAIVERITTHECRLRSVVFFDTNAVLEFDLRLPDRPALSVRGRVAARMSKGPRFVYTLALDKMSANETDELARGLAQTHRERANPRLRSPESLKDLPTTDGLTRAKMRQETEFTILFRTAMENFKPAKAGNISTGGMLMTCGTALIDGMPLELRFTLPSGVLEVYPEETSVLDLRNLAMRRTVPSKLRRPFGEMILQARVAFHKPVSPGVYNYGLTFQSLDRTAREELARYVDAVRHAKLRAAGKPR